MRNWIILLGLSIALVVRAAEVISQLEIDGKQYESVRWGPINNGKIVVLHSRGAAMVPVEKIPEPYHTQLGIKDPVKPALPEAPAIESRGESAFERAQRGRGPIPHHEGEAAAEAERQAATAIQRGKWSVINGELVEKDKLTQITGFVRSRAEARDGDKIVTRGTIVELAERRDPSKHIPAQLEMRPGLWKETGERVFLQDYVYEGRMGDLIRLYGQEQEERSEERHV